MLEFGQKAGWEKSSIPSESASFSFVRRGALLGIILLKPDSLDDHRFGYLWT